MGLGTAARGIAHALESAAIPFNVLNFEQGNPSLHRDQSWKHKEVSSSAYDFTVLAINPDNILNATELVQQKSVRDRYSIGYWFWELPEIPPAWQFSFPLVDEVWAASRFIQDAISARSPVPVFQVPIPVQLKPGRRPSREAFSLPDRRFLFLSMSDTQSQLVRKNPLGVVQAFQKAFSRDNEQAGLVLRINNVNTVHDDRERIAQIRDEIKGWPNIYLLDAPMDRPAIDALLRVSDCFVSLHRSEGFGLGPAEAMSLGKPAILTRWSGNVDYMTADNSVGIDYELVPVGQQYGPYQADQVWADPDLEQAAFWMDRLAKDARLARTIGRLGQKTIKTHFSPKAVGKIVRKRLEYLWQANSPRLQVFAPREGHYAESRSDARTFERRRWQRVKIELRQGLGDGSAPLRIDPANKIGIVEIASVSLRSSRSGRIIWRLKTREELASLTIGGTAIQLPHDRLLRLLSFSDDPQLFLPPLRGPDFGLPLTLEAWLRLDNSPRLISEALAQQGSRFAARDEELHQLRELVVARDCEKSRLLDELAALERERGELLREKAEERRTKTLLREELDLQKNRVTELQASISRINAESLTLRAQIAAGAAELASTRSRLWEAKARRADAVARLNKREQKLQDIQGSLLWKAFKPLRKLQRSFVPKEKPSIASKIAFAIDSPKTWQRVAEKIVVKGWCFYTTGEEIAGVRAKLGRKMYRGRYGLERADVVDTIGHGPISLNSGFTIECTVPMGASTIVIEAIVQGGDWQPFFQREIVRGPVEGKTREASPTARTRLPLDSRADEATQVSAALNQLRAGFQSYPQLTAGSAARFTVVTATFNTKIAWLVEAAQSLLSQTLPEWEWCIVDDGSTNKTTRRLLEGLAQLNPRVHVHLGVKGGISSATNRAIELARGDYVCFMDHDDLLTPHALAFVSEGLAEGFDVVYSDEDKYDELTGQFTEAFHKPDWSPEYLRGVMYGGHLLTVRRSLARQVGFNKAFDGVQDFEFMLRLSEARVRIGHVPEILYHWRKVPGSVATEINAKRGLDLLQKQAVDAHLARLGLPAETEIRGGHRLKIIPHRKADPPGISIIIPTKDAPDLLGRCLSSLYERTTYPRYQVIVMDNGTTDPAALDLMKRYPVERMDYPGYFNFSRVNNLGSEHASGSYLVFLNNDTEIVSPDWLEHLLYYAEQPDVGAAGPLLTYSNRTVQHAGVALGMRGTADHVMRGFPVDVDGYAGSLVCAREVSAVTAACMMMRKDRFEEVGKFNEFFSTAYQDVDLCLRLRDLGLRIIYTPEAVLIHHESVSRKNYYDMVDRMFLLDQWDTLIEKGDPYYNRNLDLERGDYSLAPR